MNKHTSEQRADYRQILKAELETRCGANPRYSLRAFARDLKVSPSRLSEIFSKKQGLSRKKAEEMADFFGFSHEEKERFCDLVEAEHARSKVDKNAANLRLKKQEKVSEIYHLEKESFKIISTWYHLAILELIKTSQFKNDTRWISKKLGITPIEAELAMDRLIRLKLLKKDGQHLQLVEDSGFVPGDVPSESIKSFHKQVLEKAANALYSQALEEREFGAYFMAIDSARLKEAKEEIRRFQHRFCIKIEKTEEKEAKAKKDSVYCLAVQFFNLGRE